LAVCAHEFVEQASALSRRTCATSRIGRIACPDDKGVFTQVAATILAMKTVVFPDGTLWPALGLGTWRLGESAVAPGCRKWRVCVQALDIGYRLIDTAEMYGDGGAEEVVGQALNEALAAWACAATSMYRGQQVLPPPRRPSPLPAACDAQPQDAWASTASTCTCCTGGAIRWPRRSTPCGTSSSRGHRPLGREQFRSGDDAGALVELPLGAECAANQVYYSLGERGRRLRSAALAPGSGACR
jgi:hypothetical protein